MNGSGSNRGSDVRCTTFAARTDIHWGKRPFRANNDPCTATLPPSSLLKKLARAKGVVIHFPGVILREGEDARTVPGSGRPFLVHPAGGADSGGSSAARDTQARSRGLEGAEP